MNTSINLYSNIDLRKIGLKKKIASYSNSYKHYIKYNNSTLLLQTPTLTLQFGITQMGNNKYIDTNIFDNDNEIMAFKNKIENINRVIIRRLSNKFINNKKYINNFKHSSNSIYPNRLRFYLNDNIIYFDEYKNKIKAINIKAKQHIKLIVCPVYIWYNNDIYGIRWEAIQLKVYGIINLDLYSFNDTLSSEIYNNIPTGYEPYFDLLKKGVPKQAVKNKLISLNMDPNVIDIPPAPPVPPPLAPPAPPVPPLTPLPPINLLQPKPKNKLLTEINKGNFKLKKVSKNIKKTTSIFKAPSLDEIRFKLNSLRKI
jgi:hypothetical protein